MKILFRFADNRLPDSIANRLRRRRFGLFRSLLIEIDRPVRILDVGGTELYWRQMDADDDKGLEIVLLNTSPQTATSPQIESVAGDAREMSRFADNEFDIVFSNSVIEHLGNWPDQQRMAAEIQRVGSRYFVQTPNRYFPLEQHFFLPGFQFLPVAARIALVRRFALGYREALPDHQDARRAVEEIRLLNRSELELLFPGGTLYRERILGLTKCFITYSGRSS